MFTNQTLIHDATQRLIDVYRTEIRVDEADLDIQDVMFCLIKPDALQSSGLMPEEDEAIDFSDWLEGGADCHVPYSTDEGFMQIALWYEGFGSNDEDGSKFRLDPEILIYWDESLRGSLIALLVRASNEWREYYQKVDAWWRYHAEHEMRDTYAHKVFQDLKDFILFV